MHNKKDMVYDLIIIGAGPAGLTAGLYAGRYRLNTLILEKLTVGGQIILSSKIENFPGFPGGVFTGELIDRLIKQIEELGVSIEYTEAKEISKIGSYIYGIKTSDKKDYQTRSIVIATGATSKKLGVEGEDRFIGRGVSYCAICDGPLFKDKEVIVVGGGDRAVEEAMFLSSYARKVYIIHRRSELRASKILQERAQDNQKISFLLESQIESILGQDKVEAVSLKNLKSNSINQLSCQGVFIFVGIKPNTDFVKNLLQMDESGFIIVDQDMRTSGQGIFACGDCCKKGFYQVITACGEAATAVHSAYNYLRNL
ncbi:MAG: thioredoxin-disulfide reductase [Candidatus Omnitrophica bacterium]|nr:thioredoxin-disulfide reductase [Candidatus Omnitrophota bacterium]